MKIYKTCPYCGANLDFGERCDCNKKTAVNATNTDSGKAGIGTHSQKPAYIIAESKGVCKHEKD